jgi:Flp pilus assembly protein TadD
MMKIAALALLVAAPLANSAAADPVDNYSATTIKMAQYTRAIARLEARVKQSPSDESALINLAVAYRHTNRSAEADALYRRVLTLEDVELDAVDGRAVMSRDVARRALMRPAQVTSR